MVGGGCFDSVFNNGEMRLGGKQTSFVYFRFQHTPGQRQFHVEDSPENVTTRALTQLIKGEDLSPLSAKPLTMDVSSIAAVCL